MIVVVRLVGQGEIRYSPLGHLCLRSPRSRSIQGLMLGMGKIMAGKLLSSAQRLLPGETVRYVFTGHTGLRESRIMKMLWDGWDLLLLMNKPRVIAVTDSSVVVMSRGRVGHGAKKVLRTLPRDTRLAPSAEGWARHRQNRIELGGEMIWVEENVYSVIEKADAERLGTATA